MEPCKEREGKKMKGLVLGVVVCVLWWRGVGSLQRATLKAEVGKREARRRQAAPVEGACLEHVPEGTRHVGDVVQKKVWG